MFVNNVIRKQIPDLKLKLIFSVGLFLLYSILFVLFYPAIGNVVGAVSILAAVAIGFFVGLKYGLLFSLCFIPLNFYLYSLFTDIFILTNMISTIIGGVVTIVSVGFAGMLSEFYNNTKDNISTIKLEREKLRNEILRRQEIEVELLETQRYLERRVEERTLELSNSYKNLEDYKKRLEKIVDERTNQVVTINSQLLSENRKLINAKHEINERNLFLHSLLNAIPLPVYIKDKYGKFLDCNLAYEKFFDVENASICGKRIGDLTNGDFANAVDQGEKRLLLNPIYREFEVVFTNKNGKNKNLLFNCSTYKKMEGELEGIVGVIIDITDIKALEHRKEIALEKEKELNKLKSNFIAHASHQFRTPLSTILTSTELLMIAKQKGLEVKIQEFHDMIIESIDSLTSLLDEILTINQADSGKIFKSVETIDVVALVKSLFKSTEENCKRNIVFNFTSNLDQFQSDLDTNMIKIIFPQILDNAVKYSKENGIINVSVVKNETDFNLIIEDFGVGIPEESKPHIFDAFYRGTNTAKIPGSGLGLSIVKSTLEMFKGQIEFSSKENEGTKFIITLPLQLN